MFYQILAQTNKAEVRLEAIDRIRHLVDLFLVSIKANQTYSLTMVLVGLMFLDILTGFIAAWINRDVDSSYSYRGMLKKAQMLLMVAAAMMFEFIYPDIPWAKIIAGFLCLTELISIVENMGRSGIPLPKQLKDTLKKLRENDETATTAKLEVKVEAPSAKEVQIDATVKPKKKGDSVTAEMIKNANGSVTTTSTVSHTEQVTPTQPADEEGKKNE